MMRETNCIFYHYLMQLGGNPNGCGSLGGATSTSFRVLGRSSAGQRPSLSTQTSGGQQRTSLQAISDECLLSSNSSTPSAPSSTRDSGPGDREPSSESPLPPAQQENLFRTVLEASLSTEVGLIVLDLVCQFATTFKVCSSVSN